VAPLDSQGSAVTDLGADDSIGVVAESGRGRGKKTRRLTTAGSFVLRGGRRAAGGAGRELGEDLEDQEWCSDDGSGMPSTVQLGEDARVAEATVEWQKSKLPSSEKAAFTAGFAAAWSADTGCRKMVAHKSKNGTVASLSGKELMGFLQNKTWVWGTAAGDSWYKCKKTPEQAKKVKKLIATNEGLKGLNTKNGIDKRCLKMFSKEVGPLIAVGRGYSFDQLPGQPPLRGYSPDGGTVGGTELGDGHSSGIEASFFRRRKKGSSKIVKSIRRRKKGSSKFLKIRERVAERSKEKSSKIQTASNWVKGESSRLKRVDLCHLLSMRKHFKIGAPEFRGSGYCGRCRNEIFDQVAKLVSQDDLQKAQDKIMKHKSRTHGVWQALYFLKPYVNLARVCYADAAMTRNKLVEPAVYYKETYVPREAQGKPGFSLLQETGGRNFSPQLTVKWSYSAMSCRSVKCEKIRNLVAKNLQTQSWRVDTPLVHTLMFKAVRCQTKDVKGRSDDICRVVKVM